jgi:hypothetical protein
LTRPPSKSDFVAYRGEVLRMVEAQHRISTSRLTDSLVEEERLEQLIEEVKPPLPSAARKLHYLLATPFRYGHRSESRFRKAGERPGIFYASESKITCLCEMAYWRMRFFAASPDAALPTTTTEYLMFGAEVGAPRSLDLARKPFSAARSKWTDPSSYADCQRFADQARKVSAQLIRYESARDLGGGFNIALLDPACFRSSVPANHGTWHFRFLDGKLVVISASPLKERYEFEPGKT